MQMRTSYNEEREKMLNTKMCFEIMWNEIKEQ